MLRYLSTFDANFPLLSDISNVPMDWKSTDYQNAKITLKDDSFRLDVEKVDFFGLHYHLDERHAYNHSIHNRPRLHRLIETSPFVVQ